MTPKSLPQSYPPRTNFRKNKHIEDYLQYILEIIKLELQNYISEKIGQ